MIFYISTCFTYIIDKFQVRKDFRDILYYNPTHDTAHTSENPYEVDVKSSTNIHPLFNNLFYFILFYFPLYVYVDYST